MYYENVLIQNYMYRWECEKLIFLLSLLLDFLLCDLSCILILNVLMWQES